jgi:uncharacterized repeat protein (TIGR01451 family)
MVTNTGNVDLKFVNVSDPSLGAVTCPIPAPPGLTPGASEVCTGDVQHIVTAADVRAGKVDDTATADGTDTTGKGSGPSGPSRTHTRVVRPSTKLTITKTVNRARAMPGQTLTYTITVTNHGPDDAPDVQVTDTPSIPLTHIHAHPSQGRCETRPRLTCLLGTIRQGHRATIRLTGTPSRSGTERNTATVGFSGHDTAPAVAGVTTHVGGSLELRKTPSEKTAKAGQTLTYTLRVTNPGSRAVSHVTVCDPLPSALVYVSSTPRAGLYDGRYCWSISSLAGHHARSVTITANVAPGRGGDVSNRATASGRGVSPVRATATVKVAPAGRTVCPGAPDTARREPPRAHAAC